MFHGTNSYTKYTTDVVFEIVAGKSEITRLLLAQTIVYVSNSYTKYKADDDNENGNY